jgi:hypothetical protein
MTSVLPADVGGTTQKEVSCASDVAKQSGHVCQSSLHLDSGNNNSSSGGGGSSSSGGGGGVASHSWCHLAML